MKTLGDLVERNRMKAFNKEKKSFAGHSWSMVGLALFPVIHFGLKILNPFKWSHISEEEFFYTKLMTATYLYEGIVLALVFGYIFFNVRKGIVLAEKNFKALKIGSYALGIRMVAVVMIHSHGREYLPIAEAYCNSLYADLMFTLFFAFFMWFTAKFMEYGIQLREEQDSIV